MAQRIGERYSVGKVPLRLYWSSDRAAAKNTSQSGYIQETGNYPIKNVLWANSSGRVVNSDPGTGGVALYALMDKTNSWVLGWIRDDENITRGRLTKVPYSVDVTSSAFTVEFTKMKGTTYSLEIDVAGNVVYSTQSYAGNNSYNLENIKYDISLNENSQNKILSAMKDSTVINATISLVTYLNGNSLGVDSKSFTFNATNASGPEFISPPKYSYVNQSNGINYAGITEVYISTKPVVQASRGAKDVSVRYNSQGLQNIGPSHWKFVEAGTASITYTYTDSRGLTAKHTDRFQVSASKPISVLSVSASRKGRTGIEVSATGEYTSTVDGTPRYTILYRKRGDLSWSTLTSGTATGSNGRFRIEYTESTGFEPSSAYDVQVKINGKVSNAIGYSVLGTESVPLSMGEHGSGVGVMFDNSSKYMLQVGDGGMRSIGNLLINNNGKMSELGPGTLNTNVGNFQFNSDVIANGYKVLTEADIGKFKSDPFNFKGNSASNGLSITMGNILICVGQTTLSGGGNGYYYSGKWNFPKSFSSTTNLYTFGSVATTPSKNLYQNWNGNVAIYNPTTSGVSLWWAGTHDSKTLSGTVKVNILAIGLA